MLFSTPDFLFGFLPIVLAGYLLLGRLRQPGLALLGLGLASLVFYGWDDPARLIPLILGSIAFNFVVGRTLARRRSRALLWFGVGANLLLLAVFKYADLFLSTLMTLIGGAYDPLGIKLPIGISFFTFTQIAFLVDAARGEAKEYQPHNYLLFVTYFPHLVAGPILHHKEIMPQFGRPDVFRFDAARFALGLSWFAIGLFKKVVLADGISRFVAPVYNAAAAGGVIQFADAWIATASFALQLYFDFSGYSDMAIGISLMMGIMLPINFNSPYKATSLVDFWRRWHITLSRFLRDYLYIPLGGNRRGALRRYMNLIVTMLLGGLWHGASWNFLLWGAIHGVGLALNNLWRDLVRWRMPKIAGLLLTLVVVLVAWVPFRAESFAASVAVWKGMMNYTNAASLHLGLLEALSGWWVAGLAAIALLCPNTQNLLQPENGHGRLRWRINWCWATALGLLGGAALGSILEGQVSEFLYFRF